KRFIFYKRLLPLLEFGREHKGIDLSKIILTHHNFKSRGKQAMPSHSRKIQDCSRESQLQESR
ncbi:MAG TPA: hypothetical protein PK164_08330, partial [Nitrosomonas sp.]|nr:hypothetical protein [Nitrosomonas sp.]